MTEQKPGLRQRAEWRLAGQELAAAAGEPELQRLVHELRVRQVELEMQNEALLELKAAAEAASHAKGAFLANMSHEIRTPLNAITGFAHLIRAAGVTEEQADYLDKLEASGDHLLSVINAILDLSKIEAGKLELREEEFSLEAVAANVDTMLRDRLQSKPITLHSEVCPLSVQLIGDPTRLHQALLNYLGNAIKFTERGAITLRIRPAMEEAGSVLLRFEVEDTGIGIAPERLDKLFNAFEQADNSATRQYGGTGLGLAITRKLAELMGGQAGASSRPGAGSTFWFTARLKKGAARPVPRPSLDRDLEELLRRDRPGHRILLVDDEPMNRGLARVFLENAGQSVDEAPDGLRAVEMAGAEGYHLILMDMQMPRMSGVEAAQRIRRLDGRAEVPILAMTGNAFMEDRERCRAAGMNDFLAKPFKPAELYELLLKWLPA